MLDSKQQIFEQIKKAKSILIAFPSIWNGDNISSSLALFLFLKKIGKNADIISNKDEGANTGNKAGKIFSFLPGFNQIKRVLLNSNNFIISLNTGQIKIKNVKYKIEGDSLKFIITPKKGNFSAEDVKTENKNSKYDLIITIGATDMESLGKLFEENTEFFYNTSIINIDHHSANEEYGQINLVKINAVSTSEILFSLFESFAEKSIDADIATCLLAGIISGTKNFKTTNITPDTLLATSQLISREARRDEIINRLYRSRDLSVLKLWGRVLSRLSGLKNNRIIWSMITLNDFLKTGASKNDLSEIIEELIVNIPEAKIIIIFYETPEKEGEPTANFIIHSPKNINLIDLIESYNPRGGEKTAEIETKKKLEELKREIVDLVDKKIEELNF